MADMQSKGASPEKIADAGRAFARGEGYDGVQPGTEFVKASVEFTAGELFGFGLGAILGKASSLFSIGPKGTGAFLDGATGGADLGKLTDRQVSVSEKGLGLVESHLEKFGFVPENNLMVSRLRTALAEGKSIEGADASFYIHELSESTMMSRGMDYSTAHQGALSKYQVSPYSVYHPDVINVINAAEPGSFNANWLKFWGQQ